MSSQGVMKQEEPSKGIGVKSKTRKNEIIDVIKGTSVFLEVDKF